MSCSASTLLTADPRRSETRLSASSSPARGAFFARARARAHLPPEFSNLRATPRSAHHLGMDPSTSGHDAGPSNHHHHHHHHRHHSQHTGSQHHFYYQNYHQHNQHHASLTRQQSDMNDSATSSSQHTVPQSIVNSQESNYSSSSEHAIASPASDHSSVADKTISTNNINNNNNNNSTTTTRTTTTLRDANVRPDGCRDGQDAIDQLLHLSTIAAAQDRISLDAASTDSGPSPLGAFRDAPSSIARSLARGHARNPSAISIASTSGSTIGELSAELKTRLSYAMVKVNLGLQTHSIEEVECLASQAASASPAPGIGARAGVSSRSGRQASSVSPDMALDRVSAQGHFLHDARIKRRKSDSPLSSSSLNKSNLDPPASIQATLSTPAARLHPRRNSTPRHPALLHSHSSAPQTPGYSIAAESHQSSSQPARISDSLYYASQTRNSREQDAVETLLFMSSPNNSANMKHVFSPLACSDPAPQAAKSSSSTTTKPGASGSSRKSLPSHRPTPGAHKKPAGMLHPNDSPMALDSPQHSYYSSNRVTPRRRNRGNSTHLRSSLSLPVALGGGHSSARRVLRDEDIERMLDRVAAETADSSDDEDIQIPRLKNGVAGVMGIRG